MHIEVLGSSSSGNCYIIHSEAGNLIIECGIPFRYTEKALSYDFSNVLGVLVTHEHGDHCGYIKDYIRHFKVFATRGTFEKCGFLNHHNSNVVDYMKTYNIGDYRVLPFKTIHDAEQPCGYAIKLPTGDNMVFATDTSQLNVNFGNISYWLVECNYDIDILRSNVAKGVVNGILAQRIAKSHLSLRKCIDMFSVNNLSRTKIILLIHLSEKNSDRELFRREISRVTGKSVFIAQKGTLIELL